MYVDVDVDVDACVYIYAYVDIYIYACAYVYVYVYVYGDVHVNLNRAATFPELRDRLAVRVLLSLCFKNPAQKVHSESASARSLNPKSGLTPWKQVWLLACQRRS